MSKYVLLCDDHWIRGESRVKELRVDKKLRNKIIGTGYKKTVEWTQAKIKRIIFIDIFAAIPEVAALIALIDALLKKMETWELVVIPGGVWCSTALIPLCVAIIYYKIIRNNSSVSYEMYKEEQLFYDDEGFTFSFTDYGGVPGNWTYQIKYKEIEDLIDYPNISMIRIIGHYPFELFQNGRVSVYNRECSDEIKVSIGYYYDAFDEFKRTLSEKSGLKFETKDY